MPADPSPNEKGQHETQSDGETEEDYGEETEFTAVDSKEKTVIENWVQQYRHLFGTTGGRVPDEGSDKNIFVSNGPLTIHQIVDESDSSDGSFSAPSTPSGSSDSSPESDGEEGGDDENASGGGSDSGCAEEGENEGGSNEEEEELDRADHPLLQAGALPQMSKNVMDLAVGMVMSDMMVMRNKSMS